MSTLNRAVFTLCLVILLVSLYRQSRPLNLHYDGQHINVTRDKFGIPDITGTDLNGVMYGLGYCMTNDRMFQMHMRRMAASGRLSEMFGDRALQTDIMFREIGLRGWAERGVEKVLHF